MLNIRVFRENLQKAIRDFPDELAENVGDAMERSRGVFLKKFQREQLNFPRKGPVQDRGGGLRKNTSQLSLSFDGLTKRGDLDSTALNIWSAGVKYAQIHEFGDTFRNIIPRLGFFDAWEAHIDTDLMPRLEKATAKTIKQGGF